MSFIKKTDPSQEIGGNLVNLTENKEYASNTKNTSIPFIKALSGVFAFLKKKIRLIIILIIFIFSGITAFQVFTAVQSSKNVFQSEKQTFEEVESKDISNSISVTGTIASSETRTLSTLVSKTEVTDVFVEVGDYVREGDPICTFDTSSIESNIRKLEREITVNNAKATLELAKANTQVAWAWEDYFYNQSMGEYDLGSAMNNYVQQQNSVADAIDTLNQRERELDSLKDEYHDYKKAKRNGTVSEGSYKSSSSDYKDSIATAEEAVSSAGRSLENAQLQLQNSIDNYNKTVETLKHQGVTDLRTISSNMASVVETQLNNMTGNDSAEEQIREYKKDLDNCNITAPISGLITSVSVVEGDEYDEKSTICVIQDDSSYKVSGTVDQYDISSITESMNCVIKTDATGDDQMEGVLTFVSPVPQSSSSGTSDSSGSGSSGSSSSSTEYPIEITIKGRDERLRIGMTAEASILLESKEGVKAVPYDAIEEAEDGSFYVNAAVSGAVEGAGEDSSPAAQNDKEGAQNDRDMVRNGKEGAQQNDAEAARNDGKGAQQNDAARNDGEVDISDKAASDRSRAPGRSGSSGNNDSYSGNPVANYIAEKIIGKSASELYAETAETPTRRVTVKKGLETDYYTEIISDELEVGDRVLVQETESSDNESFGFDVGFGGPGGGPGGGPRGGF